MKKLYEKLCKAEMWLAIICLLVSVSVIFLSAVLRTIKNPIRWGLDIALLLFTWSTFLGADIAFREKALVRVDMLTSRFPKKLQKVLEAITYVLMVIAILFLLVQGTKLTLISSARSFQGTPWLSYSWVNACVPVSMFLMLINVLIQIYQTYFNKNKVTQNETPVGGEGPC